MQCTLTTIAALALRADQRYDKSHPGKHLRHTHLTDVQLYAADSGEETNLLSFTRTEETAGPGPHPSLGPALVIVAGAVS